MKNKMNIFSIDLSVEAFVGSLIAIGVIFLFCRKVLVDDFVLCIPDKKRHNWKSIKSLKKANVCFCNVCELLLTTFDGVFCECCGICAHVSPSCSKKADRELKCKDKYLRNKNSMQHLWVHGNMPLAAVCNACSEEVDNVGASGLQGWRCAWCQRTYHDNCYQHIDEKGVCDLGEFSDLIVPPYSVVASRTRQSIRMHLVRVKPTEIENWAPLIVIVNAKSGSNTGADVVCSLRGYLHPHQVMELSSRGPQEALQWAAKASPRPCRILVAGGDGTIGWVLNTIYMLNIKPQPSVAILPLGTGNDLSRVLGWGSQEPDMLNPTEILRKIQKARSVNLDRFDLQIERIYLRLPIQRYPTKTVHVYSYFSIGVDALVTYNFHKARESPFYFLSHRLFNKLIYMGFGTQQMVQRDCEGLEKKVTLYLDNKHIELPELQALVFLNIDSWGAGCKLCELSNQGEEEQMTNSISDGVMEVFGIVSSFHMAQLQCKISKPVRIGQAKQIKLETNCTCPMQADGEPWIQPAARMQVQCRGQVRMLKYENNEPND